jgi:hypothetical protein
MLNTTCKDNQGNLHSYSFDTRNNEASELPVRKNTGTCVKVYLPKIK